MQNLDSSIVLAGEFLQMCRLLGMHVSQLLVHVTVVPLREAVARKLRDETKRFCS